MKKSELRKLIKEEVNAIFEKLEYDEDKLDKLIQNTDDETIKHQFESKVKRGKMGKEEFFYKIVIGDDDLEKQYMNL